MNLKGLVYIKSRGLPTPRGLVFFLPEDMKDKEFRACVDALYGVRDYTAIYCFDTAEQLSQHSLREKDEGENEVCIDLFEKTVEGLIEKVSNKRRVKERNVALLVQHAWGEMNDEWDTDIAYSGRATKTVNNARGVYYIDGVRGFRGDEDLHPDFACTIPVIGGRRHMPEANINWEISRDYLDRILAHMDRIKYDDFYMDFWINKPGIAFNPRFNNVVNLFYHDFAVQGACDEIFAELLLKEVVFCKSTRLRSWRLMRERLKKG
ncbi:hypothetical protein KY328_00985 [Candidatus Woesearchaeota archaeon]|nr:hypothetical protein [Candidatus Woesearchaeota archaeon]